MKNRIVKPVMILVLTISSYYPISLNAQSQQKTETMKSFISIFEIPATDINRAVEFYQSILDIKIDIIDMQGMQMGILPSEGHAVSGVITQGEGYEPSPNGVIIYLNGGDNLETILNKVEKSGGQVVVPKSLIDEENGYFGMFMDSEGNKIGVHSPN